MVTRGAVFAPAWIIVLFMVLSGVVPAAAAAPGPDASGAGLTTAEPFALVERARALHDLFRLADRPYRLRANVAMHRLKTGSKEGQYIVKRFAANDWFAVLQFPGFQELVGASGELEWRRRPTVDRPLRVHQAFWTLDILSHLDLPPGTEGKLLPSKRLGDRDARCASFTPSSLIWQHDSVGAVRKPPVGPDHERSVELCFDAETGALLRADYGTPLPVFEYEGHVDLGSLSLPRTARYLEDNETAVEATIVELADDPDATSGPPPKGAETWRGCAHPEPAVLTTKKSVREVPSAKVRRQFGTVIAFGEIGIDGRFHDLAIFQGVHASLNAAVRDALDGWEYAPATCDGKPVPQQVYLAVQFRP